MQESFMQKQESYQEDRPTREKQKKTQLSIVCTGQYLNKIHELNIIFQSQHIDASMLLDPANEDLIKKDLKNWKPTMVG